MKVVGLVGSVCSPTIDDGLVTAVLAWLNDGHSLVLSVLNTWLVFGATRKSFDLKLKVRVHWLGKLSVLKVGEVWFCMVIFWLNK